MADGNWRSAAAANGTAARGGGDDRNWRSGGRRGEETSARDVGGRIPANVKEAILHFRMFVNDRNVAGILSMYDNAFPKITEQYYQKSEMPHPDQVKELLNPGGEGQVEEKDKLFVLLYAEMFYRHIHRVLQPTLAHRVFAWENYCDLFFLMSSQVGEESFDVELPVQWLWDIIDEYLEQFESWRNYTSKVDRLGDEEIEYLKIEENGSIWNTVAVLKYLDYLKKKSGIVAWLEAGGERGLVPEDSPAFVVEDERTGSNSTTYRMLGYFCIIGELRLHCLFRDYHLALNCIAPIDLSDSGLFSNVLACHVSLFYYMGVSYFMMRRYTDAASTWTNIITILEKSSSSRDKKSERVRSDRMYGMLAISLSLCPIQIDASVSASLQEKHGDDMDVLVMARGDEDTRRTIFEKLLFESLPRNISAAPPNFDDRRDQSNDATAAQRDLFLEEVSQHLDLPNIRSYLKLYSSVGVDKLSAFCRQDTEEFRTHLLSLKHKSRMSTWKTGPAISGEDQQCGDVEFYIKDDVIHVSEPAASRREARDTGDFFLYHIDRLQQIVDDTPKRR